MAKSDMIISIEHRRAEVYITTYVKVQLGLSDDKYFCNVYGPFQSTDGDYAAPVFVCELDDGRVFNAETNQVRFVDTIGEMEQCT